MVYKVNIIENYSRVVAIEANSYDEAFDIIEKKIEEGIIDLPCDGGEYDYSRDLFRK